MDVVDASAVTTMLVIVLGLLGVMVFEWQKVGRSALALRRNPCAYRSRDPSGSVYVPERAESFWQARRKARELGARILGTEEDNMELGGKGIDIIGGATGHRYHLSARYSFGITDLDAQELLCALPFNSWQLPQADTMLTQALYLQCPETERAFLALCNKLPFTHRI